MMEDAEGASSPDRGPRIPPAPEWRLRQGDRLGGLEILRELPEGDTCFSLWRILRDIDMWEERSRAEDRLWPAPSAEKRRMLRQASTETPELRKPLSIFGRRGATAARLATACSDVFGWAERQGYVETAAHFAEVAAYLDPTSPARHHAAARLCRRLCLYSRAELWFRRSFHLAGQQQSRTEAVRALLGYGRVLKDQGLHDEARVWLTRAAKRARWTGRPHYAAEAHHDLAALEAEAGMLGACISQMQHALGFYSRGNERIPYLIHDAAFLLLTCGYYSQALPILDALLKIIQRPDERVLVWGSIAWASGFLRLRDRFSEAEEAILRLAPLHQEYASSAFLHLGDAARAFGRWAMATTYVHRAATVALARADALVVNQAADLQLLIEGRIGLPLESDAPAPEDISHLARACHWKLRCWRPRKRRQLPEPNV